MSEAVLDKRTGIGAGLGALVGWYTLGPLGVLVGGLLGGGIAQKTKNEGGVFSGEKKAPVLTPRKKLIFKRAMESVKPPEQLRDLADAYEQEGFHGEATLLRRRAQLRSMPFEQKRKYQLAFKKGMASDNPDAIEQMAIGFARNGAIDTAKTLHEHASAVRAAHDAGKSTKPLDPQMLETFAEKLCRAVVHFGPESKQSQTAAANLINAQGKMVTAEAVHTLIMRAVRALPGGQEEQSEEAATEAVEAAPVDTGAPEPQVVGPPASASVEAPTIVNGENITPEEEAAEEEAAAAPEARRMRVEP